MRLLCAGAATAFLACSMAGFADASGSCANPLETPLISGAVLNIDSRPAEIEVVGTDRNAIHVLCNVDDPDVARDLELRFSGVPSYGKLTVIGGPMGKGNIRIRVEVPRKTNLRIHTPAGEVKVEEVAGDKDIDLYAGQITISSAQGWSYRYVNTSVVIGEVKAPVYGIDKGGFFRSFTKTVSGGEYRLRAHVMTGEIDLR